MFLRLLPVALVCAQPSPAARLSDTEQKLLNEVAKRAAYAQAWSDFCADAAPDTNAANQQALQAWQRRNHWGAIRAAFGSQPKFAPAFEQTRQQYLTTVKKKASPTACRTAATLMAGREFDLSLTRGEELQLLVSRMNGQTPSAAAPSAPAAADPPPSLAPTERAEETASPVPVTPTAPRSQAPGSASQPAAPVEPLKGKGGLEGLYWGSSISNRLNAMGSLELKARRHYLLLLRDGTVYRGLPSDGKVYDIDMASIRQSNPGMCGVYSIQGDLLLIDWNNPTGPTRRQEIRVKRFEGNRLFFRINNANMHMAQPVRNLRLNGKYVNSRYSGTPAGASNSVSVSGETSIAFTPDGRYQQRGFTAFSSSTETGNGRAGSAGSSKAAPQSGSYVLDGFRLSLKPDNGPQQDFTCLIENPTGNIGALFINGAAYLK